MRTLLRAISAILLVVFLACWWGTGADAGWTKTTVTTMLTDEVTGIAYPQVEQRLVLGIDFLAVGVLAALLPTIVSFLPIFRKTSSKPTHHP